MKRLTLYSMIMLMALAAGCAYYNTFYNAQHAFKKGRDASLKEQKRSNSSTVAGATDYDRAIEKCQKVLDVYPKSRWVDDALLLMGKSYYYKEQYFPALRSLNKSLTQFPDTELKAEIELYRAMCFFAQGQEDSTEYTLSLIAQLKPSSDIESQMAMLEGQMWQSKDDFGKAAEFYQKAADRGLKEAPHRANIALATMLDTLGRYEDAMRQYDKISGSDAPLNWRVWSKIRYARALARSGEFSKAIRYYEGLLSNDKYKSEFGKIKLAIAETLIQAGRIDEAIMAYNNLIIDHPNTAEASTASYMLGRLYENEKNDLERALLNYHESANSGKRSAFSDSAKIYERDIQRFFALTQVIRMADRGETGDLDVGQLEIASDSTNAAIADSLRAQAQLDSLNLSQANNAGQELDDYNRMISQGTDQKNKEKKLIENPELTSFKTSETDKNHFLLAELFLFRFSSPDSAAAHYMRIIQEHPESGYRVRAMYNLSYIADKQQDEEEKKLWSDRIKDEYPDSKYAAAGSEGSYHSDPETALMHAEKLLFNEKKIDAAYRAYQDLEHKYPLSEQAASALLAQAWIAETHWDSTALAQAHYDSLYQRYPLSDQGKVAKLKLDAAEKGLPKDPAPAPEAAPVAAETQLAASDSLQQEEQGADNEKAQAADTIKKTEPNRREEPKVKAAETNTVEADKDVEEDPARQAMMMAMQANQRRRGNLGPGQEKKEDIATEPVPAAGMAALLEAIKKNVPDWNQLGAFVHLRIKLNGEGIVEDIQWIRSANNKPREDTLLETVRNTKFIVTRDQQNLWLDFKIELNK